MARDHQHAVGADRPAEAEPGPAPCCPACGAVETTTIADVPDHEYGLAHVARYAHCASCLTAYQFPMPRESDLAGFYPATYHSMTDGGWLMDARRSMRLRRMKKLLGARRGTVLDYGCGNGSFLVTAARGMPENGYLGFEYSDRPEQISLADGKVTLIRGTLADLLPHLPPLQMFIMNHVIEHLPNPGEVVRALYQRLLPGGIFDGQTPNADSLEHRIFGLRWSGYHAPRHTVVFSGKGLATFLRNIGFADVEIHGAFNPAGIAVSLGSVPQGGAAGLVVRKGLAWHGLVAGASALMPVDLLSGAPGMINFRGRRPAGADA